MREQKNHLDGVGRSRRWSLSLPAMVLAFAASIAPSSAAQGGNMGFGAGGGDGDAVGSLPGEHSGGPGAGNAGLFDPTVEQFRLVLVGDRAKLNALVQGLSWGASGSGQVHVVPLGNDGLARVTFSGDATLTLDRALLESSFVAVQLEVGPVFGGGALAVKAGGKIARTAAVPGTLPLHLQQLVAGPDALIDAGVELRATSPGGKSRALKLITSGADRQRIVLELSK